MRVLETVAHHRRIAGITAVLVVLGMQEAPIRAGSQALEVFAEADATIHGESGGVPALANGSGDSLYLGMTGGNSGPSAERRSLLRFDVAGALPAGATILSAELDLRVDLVAPCGAGPTPALTRVHALLSPWTEGPSPGQGGGGGIGSPAQDGDVTWLHGSYPGQFWIVPGGDYETVASTQVAMETTGPYTLPSTAETVADVQGWLDDPAANHGWILIGDETEICTARRLHGRSRTGTGAEPPVLRITYAGAPPVTDIPVSGRAGRALLVLLLAGMGLVLVRRW